MAELPVIPENVTVHLGPPDSAAQNVTLSFADYIKNVASSEIYPTWPENALRANIYAQISFALNRIYTEYYRSRGYDFDITNSTAIDQSFVFGRDIFDNISEIVDDIFNDYIARQGFIEPLYALYCDGVNTMCDGLSQWGTVELAEQGYIPYDILRYYYGDDINIVRDAPIENVSASYPGVPLRLGSAGNDVRTLQTRLNRISANYPAIPKISAPDGIFTTETEDAVLEFQRIFGLTADGIVGKATWYRIQAIYNAVKKLNELESEGLTLSEVEKQFSGTLAFGDTGIDVSVVQYFLATVADFNQKVPPLAINGVFDEQTRASLLAFQREYGLPETGEADEETWNRLASVYRGLIASVAGGGVSAEAFPGVLLTLGSSGEDVEAVQTFLGVIAEVYTEISPPAVSGNYDAATENAVRVLQGLFGLPESGVVGPITWALLAEKYNEIENGKLRAEFQYPGDTIS
ncbi:MAG: peptidoglycan-binding protein [Clostridia bacterium]|nr:peptidoglycan-binding protein [Clostridia bacterium]